MRCLGSFWRLIGGSEGEDVGIRRSDEFWGGLKIRGPGGEVGGKCGCAGGFGHDRDGSCHGKDGMGRPGWGWKLPALLPSGRKCLGSPRNEGRGIDFDAPGWVA